MGGGLLTATRSSALLSFHRVRLREVRRMVLLMDPETFVMLRLIARATCHESGRGVPLYK